MEFYGVIFLTTCLKRFSLVRDSFTRFSNRDADFSAQPPRLASL
jgi:hypothetical protein